MGWKTSTSGSSQRRTDRARTAQRSVDADRARTELPGAEKYVSDRNLLLLAELYSQHEDHPQWDTRIGIYLRSNGRSYEIVGIERDSPQEFVPMH